jgi:hypothetical protein
MPVTPFIDTPRAEIWLSDEAMLRLLLGATLQHDGDETTFRSAYQSARSAVIGPPPSFDDLVAAGWLTPVWSRVMMSTSLSRVADASTDPTLAALRGLLKSRYRQNWSFSAALKADPELAQVVAEIDGGVRDWRDIGCRRPEWVAARLWESLPTGSADVLQAWHDRWMVLGAPNLRPNTTWNEAEADRFRNAVLARLSADAGPEWEDCRGRRLAELALCRPGADTEESIPPVPVTVVGRARWLGAGMLEELFHDVLLHGPLYSLVAFLLDDLIAEPQAGPHRAAGEVVIDLATDHPTIMFHLLWHAGRYPQLLADLTIRPDTVALAGWLVASRRSDHNGGWFGHISEQDARAGRRSVFSDIAQVLGEDLRAGRALTVEAAELLAELYRPAGPAHDLDVESDLLPDLRRALVNQAPETIGQMVTHLTTNLEDAIIAPGLRAALDLVGLYQVSPCVDLQPIVRRYVSALAPPDYDFPSTRLSPRACAALARASEGAPELRAQFLKPFDLVALGKAVNQDAWFMFRMNYARALRAHIRVLCRAVAGSAPAPPSDLVTALSRALLSAREDRPEKGRLPALAARFDKSPIGRDERPLADDLAMALQVLAPKIRDEVFRSVLASDEPYILAQLAQRLSPELKPALAQRLVELPPEEAADTWSPDEDQARLDALLSANLASEAELYLSQTLATTQGRPERLAAAFRAKVRLAFIRRDQKELWSLTPPEKLRPYEREAAEDTLFFFKGLLAYHAPNGAMLEEAERIFGALARKRSSVVAYTLNHLAARMSLMLRDDVYARLSGAQSDEARSLIETARALKGPAGQADREILSHNIALLQLAVGEPEAAIETLSAASPLSPSPHGFAFRAVALNRLGQGRQALAIIEAARQTYPGDTTLAAALRHINSQAPNDAAATTILTAENVVTVKAALSDLRNSAPDRQAAILGQDSLGHLVQDILLQGCASLVGLRSTLRAFELDNSEDHISVVLRELLQTRVHDLNWSVGDQSKGGWSAKGNFGERDLTLRHLTTDVAVVEAIVCRERMTNNTQVQLLRGHFQKLLGYSHCRLFAHVTYAKIGDVAAILSTLEQIARVDAPAGFTYLRDEKLPLVGNRPPGFVARYDTAASEVEVTFLVLDLHQQIQRDAAALAARSKSAKGNAPPKAAGKSKPKPPKPSS